ncbi:MAG: hypothetical protein AB1609_07470 [Bacillota bacterium]
MSNVRLGPSFSVVTALVFACFSPFLSGAPVAAAAQAGAHAGDGSGLWVGWLWPGEGGDARPSWQLRLSAGASGQPGITLQLGGASAGAVPVGKRAESELLVSYGSLGWEGPERSAHVEVSRGQRYPDFPGALGLVDGTVLDEATRAWAARLTSGRFEAGALCVRQAPLWYTHARRVAGDAWALRLGSGNAEAQVVVADTGLHRLDFVTRPPIDVRRVEAALAGGFRLKPATGTELTAEVGVSQRAERDGDELTVENGWAAFVRLRKAGARPGWRLEGYALSPAFDSPLWGERAPARGRATVEGRWSWARGKGPVGGWVSGEATQDLVSGRARGKAEAGLTLRAGSGALAFGLAAELAAADGASFRSDFSVGYESKTGSLALELDADAGVQWAGQVRPGGGWYVRTAWRPDPGIVRLEVGRAPPGTSSRGWPPPGVRVAGKWSGAVPRPYVFAEAGWSLGDFVTIGFRLGRWDEGRLDLFYDEPVSLLVMTAWRFA